MNFLQETILALKEAGKEPERDIAFIGSIVSGHELTWNEFVALANFEYDEGFGAQKIASDLVIIFIDRTFLDRHEYDGSECWVYRSARIPKPRKRLKVTTLRVADAQVGWRTLAELNDAEES